MKIVRTIREPRQWAKQFYALVVTLLAFGLFAQAVHAKNSDYLPKINQTVRFSTTVKIADLAQHVVVSTPETVSVPRGILPPARPQSVRILYIPEISPRELSAQISFRPLRSPPMNS